VLARLTGQFPDIELVMVGPDKRDGSLQTTRKVASDLGVMDRIQWIAGVAKEEVPRHLNEGDIFLNTTDFDNTPVSVLEAMACGMCVISTNVGGLPYLVKDEEEALLVPPGDAEAMADAVRRVLIEPGLAERLSRNARARAEQCDWATIMPQWEELLRGVAGGTTAQMGRTGSHKPIPDKAPRLSDEG
jgi:glycosyltransferase involved in cell wall biosynthesis